MLIRGEVARESGMMSPTADDLTGLGECIRGSKDLVAQCPLLTRTELIVMGYCERPLRGMSTRSRGQG
jgi:hypothetical protein